MIVLMLRQDCATFGGVPPLPAELRMQVWRASGDGLPRRDRFFAQNMAWLAMTRLGLLATPELIELTLWQGDTIEARMILTPRWFRFPFMAAGEMQAGEVWVRPEARRLGLGRLLLAQCCELASLGGAPAIWYLVDAGNAASRALAAVCGFRPVACGRRTRRFGLRALGTFSVG